MKMNGTENTTVHNLIAWMHDIYIAYMTCRAHMTNTIKFTAVLRFDMNTKHTTLSNTDNDKDIICWQEVGHHNAVVQHGSTRRRLESSHLCRLERNSNTQKEFGSAGHMPAVLEAAYC